MRELGVKPGGLIPESALLTTIPHYHPILSPSQENEVWETMAWKVKTQQQQLMFIAYNHPGPVPSTLHTHVHSILPRALHSLHKCSLGPTTCQTQGAMGDTTPCSDGPRKIDVELQTEVNFYTGEDRGTMVV